MADSIQLTDSFLSDLLAAHRERDGFCAGAHDGQVVYPCLVRTLAEGVVEARADASSANEAWARICKERMDLDAKLAAALRAAIATAPNQPGAQGAEEKE